MNATSPILACCGALLLTALPAWAGSEVRPAPMPKDYVPLAPRPLGSLTLGGQFSAHGTGGYLDALTALWATPSQDAAVFLDSRYRLEDNSEFISSTGLAFRKLLPEQKVILGANVFYDSIDSEHDHHFDQLGFGVEVLTHYIDWRFNYYLPENGGKPFDTTHTAAGRFSRFESGLEGFNTELGFLVPGLEKCSLELRVFGGYYHYNNPYGGDYEGFKARLEARLLPGVIADVEYWQTAVLMEGHWTAGVRVSVPFSLYNLAKGRCPFEGIADSFRPRTRDFEERMGDMIMRSPRVQTVSSSRRLVSARRAESSSGVQPAPLLPPIPLE